MAQNGNFIGIDLGGTQARVGRVEAGELREFASTRILASGTVEEVLNQIYALIDGLAASDIEAIGVGVPSVVDVDQGIVYDVQNIPAWKEVRLKSLLEEKYAVPVHVNNDANCFALGEKHFGKGRGHHSIIGLIIGTGFGAGIIVNDRLYSGANCGAGEFGMMPYLDSVYEHYCSGQFFTLHKGQTGEQLYKQAVDGDTQALQIFAEYGDHLGSGIKAILCAYDPEIIILGGSVRKAYDLFEEAMWASIQSFVYPKSAQGLSIELSQLDDIAILGAAALCYERDNI
ncbi:MAG: ROK family protein [Candidatus Marinimicrobia bacterium]|nr:ROK family protein [Candidatus Neomarinimicrobiota bacterium]